MKKTEEIKKYREMSKDALSGELIALQKKAAEARLKVQAGKLDNFSEVSKLRKEIARVITINSEKSAE